MEITKEQIELLKRVKGLLPNHSGFSVTNAIYISPAQQLRNSADRIEYEEKTIAEFNAFLEVIDK